MSRARPQQVKEFAQEEISANFAAPERLSAGIRRIWWCSSVVLQCRCLWFCQWESSRTTGEVQDDVKWEWSGSKSKRRH
jgi:hypothetical protein